MNGQIGLVETSSFLMDYLKFGRGDDALVILPGASVLSVMGAANAVVEAYAPLTDRFTIYLLDYRRDFPNPYPVHSMAQDAYEALRALGLNQACLFGASLGGMVAQALAIGHPEFVKKLVLGSTAARVPDDRRRPLNQWTALAEQGNAKDLCLSFGKAVYPPNVFEQARSQFEEMAKAATADDLSRFAIMMHSVVAFDVTGELGKLTCPVLAIGSTDDQVLGAESTPQIASCLGARPNFEMHLYDGYGHAAYDTAPDYKERMLRFLTA